MSDLQKILLGGAITIATGLIVAAVIAMFKHFHKKVQDKSKASVKLSSALDYKYIQSVGCPSLQLSVKCETERPLRIKDARLCLVTNNNLLAEFDKGFEQKLGFVPIDSEPQQELSCVFTPAQKPDCDNGFIIKRDDVYRFLLPICLPPILLYTKAPSEDVSIKLVGFDDKEEIVLRGLIIQNEINSVVELMAKSKQHFQSNIPTSVLIRAISSKPPNIDVAGTISKQPINFKPSDLA